MDISDVALITMITDALHAYKPPVQHRATKADFDRRIQTESVPGHREQVEYFTLSFHCHL